MKFLIFSILVTFSGKAFSRTAENMKVELSDYLKGSNGYKYYYLTSNEAEEICQDKKMQLPTAKELAVYTQKFGAIVLNADEVSGGQRVVVNHIEEYIRDPQGYTGLFRKITASNTNGTVDTFYHKPSTDYWYDEDYKGPLRDYHGPLTTSSYFVPPREYADLQFKFFLEQGWENHGQSFSARRGYGFIRCVIKSNVK